MSVFSSKKGETLQSSQCKRDTNPESSSIQRFMLDFSLKGISMCTCTQLGNLCEGQYSLTENQSQAVEKPLWGRGKDNNHRTISCLMKDLGQG